MLRALLITAATLVAALAVPSGAGALVIGIGDQKPAMFSDPRFAAEGIRNARVSVGWDVLTSDWQTAQLDDWLQAARDAGVQPLVTFGHSRTPGARRTLPSPERYRYEFRRFRERYPWVTTFATWNEANHCGEPTCHRATLVAAYYNALRKECPDCRILAAELLDMPNMVSWAEQFTRHADDEPRYWGLHNYLDANRLRTSGTAGLLAVTKGQIWFTETGGIVDRRNRSTVSFEQSPEHAALATSWLFDRLVPLSPRITRVYLYNWSTTSDVDTWDSGLFDHEGVPRPAFAVLERQLSLLAARAAERAQRR